MSPLFPLLVLLLLVTPLTAAETYSYRFNDPGGEEDSNILGDFLEHHFTATAQGKLTLESTILVSDVDATYSQYRATLVSRTDNNGTFTAWTDEHSGDGVAPVGGLAICVMDVTDEPGTAQLDAAAFRNIQWGIQMQGLDGQVWVDRGAVKSIRTFAFDPAAAADEYLTLVEWSAEELGNGDHVLTIHYKWRYYGNAQAASLEIVADDADGVEVGTASDNPPRDSAGNWLAVFTVPAAETSTHYDLEGDINDQMGQSVASAELTVQAP